MVLSDTIRCVTLCQRMPPFIAACCSILFFLQIVCYHRLVVLVIKAHCSQFPPCIVFVLTTFQCLFVPLQCTATQCISSLRFRTHCDWLAKHVVIRATRCPLSEEGTFLIGSGSFLSQQVLFCFCCSATASCNTWWTAF